MRSIIAVLSDSGMLGLFPMHPGTQKRLHEYGLLGRMPRNVRLIKPLGYLDMLMLMANARKILTHSLGIQKEAYMLGVPCITLEGEYGMDGDAGGRGRIYANSLRWCAGRLLQMYRRKAIGIEVRSERNLNIIYCFEY
ncbi:MAG: UDP-N-acetylglucosamine 2-epimerase [Candidatus Methanoperedens sp.]|nr:UDP-N-acetylglucosamine 2-epimerase [Candidatus Methanoperedens sp.]